MNSKYNGSAVLLVLVSPYGIGRDGLRSLFHSRGNVRVVAEAHDLTAAVDVVRQSSPDVVLIDTDAFNQSPAQAIEQIANSIPNARVVLMCRESEIGGMSDLSDLFAGGIKGVVLKDETSGVLLNAIDKVYAGEVWIGRRAIARILESRSREKNVSRMATSMRLSDRERDVVALVSNGCRNRQIAEALSITEATVRNHLTSVFRKTGIKDRVELAIFFNRTGLSRSPGKEPANSADCYRARNDLLHARSRG